MVGRYCALRNERYDQTLHDYSALMLANFTTSLGMIAAPTVIRLEVWLNGVAAAFFVVN